MRPFMLLLLLLAGDEADGPFLRCWRWRHQLADGIEDAGDGLILGHELALHAGFQLIEALGQFLVAGEQLAQLHESAHHVNRHLDGARAAEHRRRQELHEMGDFRQAARRAGQGRTNGGSGA